MVYPQSRHLTHRLNCLLRGLPRFSCGSERLAGHLPGLISVQFVIQRDFGFQQLRYRTTRLRFLNNAVELLRIDTRYRHLAVAPLLLMANRCRFYQRTSAVVSMESAGITLRPALRQGHERNRPRALRQSSSSGLVPFFALEAIVKTVRLLVKDATLC